jgi:hypothetical protein
MTDTFLRVMSLIVIDFTSYQLSQELSEARKLSSLLEDKVQTLQQEASRYVPATKVAEVHSTYTYLILFITNGFGQLHAQVYDAVTDRAQWRFSCLANMLKDVGFL